MEIGNRLKELRKLHKMTQAEVAEQINVIRQTYSHYETGRIVPPIDAILSLCKLYHMSVDALLFPTLTPDTVSCFLEATEYEDSQEDFSKLSTHSLLYNSQSVPEELKLLQLYRSLTAKQREELMHYAEYIQTKL